LKNTHDDFLKINHLKSFKFLFILHQAIQVQALCMKMNLWFLTSIFSWNHTSKLSENTISSVKIMKKMQ